MAHIMKPLQKISEKWARRFLLNKINDSYEMFPCEKFEEGKFLNQLWLYSDPL